ncbi:MAG: Yip1 family protein, partial [Candidatus Micrarchaeota archaeon]|nr:Yip1 family protein [Candidatus Micrarchaeota archaeon]
KPLPAPSTASRESPAAAPTEAKPAAQPPAGKGPGFFTVLWKPKETLAFEKQRASLSRGFMKLAKVGFALGLIAGIIVAAVLLFISSLIPEQYLSAIPFLGSLSTLAVILLIAFILVGTVMFPLSNLLGAIIPFICAKLFGGKGTFSQHFYLTAVTAAPILVVSILASLTTVIPLLGMLVVLLVTIYALYLVILAIKVAHEFSTLKAVAVFVACLVVGAVISYAALQFAGGTALTEIGAATAGPLTTVQATATATPAPAQVRACDAFDCLIDASRNCAPATLTNSSTVNLFGMLVTTTTFYEIREAEAGKCVLYWKTLKQEIRFSDETISKLLDSNATMGQVRQQEQEANDAAKQVEGVDVTCKFKTSDLTSMLARWSAGNISTSVSCTLAGCSYTGGDLALGECSGAGLV